MERKKKWTDFIAEDDLERVKEYHHLRNIEPHITPKNYEFHLVDKRGNIKDILLMIDIIPGVNKRVASLIDITEYKHAVEALRKRKEELKEKVKKLEMSYEMAVLKERRMKKLEEENEKLKEELGRYKNQ